MLRCAACLLLALTGWADVSAMSVPAHGFQADASSASLHVCVWSRCSVSRWSRLMLLKTFIYHRCMRSKHASEIG